MIERINKFSKGLVCANKEITEAITALYKQITQ